MRLDIFVLQNGKDDIVANNGVIHELDNRTIRCVRVDLLLATLIASVPSKKCRRTIRALWDNQWDKKATAKELGVSEKAVSVALFRFKKAAARVVSAPEFQDAYDSIFC